MLGDRITYWTIGGQSAPPSLKAVSSSVIQCHQVSYRGAVRPPFIEGPASRVHDMSSAFYRGAVRPPFIEGVIAGGIVSLFPCYRGAVRPPFIEGAKQRPRRPVLKPSIGGQSAPPSLKVQPHRRCLQP